MVHYNGYILSATHTTMVVHAAIHYDAVDNSTSERAAGKDTDAKGSRSLCRTGDCGADSAK